MGIILLQVLVGPIFNKLTKPSVTNCVKVAVVRCVLICRHEKLIHTFTISKFKKVISLHESDIIGTGDIGDFFMSGSHVLIAEKFHDTFMKIKI